MIDPTSQVIKESWHQYRSINDRQISDRICRDEWRVDLEEALSTVVLEVSRLRLQVLSSTLNMTHSKRDHGSLFTCNTSRYTMTSTFIDVQNTCVHNKPNSVTVPMMDQDEYQLHHAICKDTVPSVNEKPVDLLQGVVVRDEHVDHLNGTPSCGGRIYSPRW